MAFSYQVMGGNTHKIMGEYALNAFFKKISDFLKHIADKCVYISEHYVAPFMLCGNTQNMINLEVTPLRKRPVYAHGPVFFYAHISQSFFHYFVTQIDVASTTIMTSK